ncbi:hypothetical protein KC19_12G012400 [Ceratodon purpureus]|uniref:Uncharacterized protein n=1 Tax=Ceratodon purpureus TaxID=3225 RepID=A0A8T0G4Q4_CERPU|nr:hypothetical protein KC19_12G012400 [Ceratodon purpureus]
MDVQSEMLRVQPLGCQTCFSLWWCLMRGFWLRQLRVEVCCVEVSCVTWVVWAGSTKERLWNTTLRRRSTRFYIMMANRKY